MLMSEGDLVDIRAVWRIRSVNITAAESSINKESQVKLDLQYSMHTVLLQCTDINGAVIKRPYCHCTDKGFFSTSDELLLG